MGWYIRNPTQADRTVTVSTENPLKKHLQKLGYTETKDETLFQYADWWWNSNSNIPEDDLFKLFLGSFGYQMYLDRGYVIIEDD